MERRLVGRTKILVEGELEWATKRFIGGRKDHRVKVSTLDLSVDGAQLLAHGRAPLPAGASCLLHILDVSTTARVRGVTNNESGQQVLRLQLENPPQDFLELVEEWLDADKGGKKFRDTRPWYARDEDFDAA